MKARQLIDSAAFEPKELKTIREAFEDAWGQIALSVGKRPEAIEAARLKLANVILSLARNGIPSREQLTHAALKMMFADPTRLHR